MNRLKLGRVGKGVCVDRVVGRAFRPDLSFWSFFMFLVVDVYYPNLHIWMLSCDSVVLRMNQPKENFEASGCQVPSYGWVVVWPPGPILR